MAPMTLVMRNTAVRALMFDLPKGTL